jgi:hypothetical protein
LLREQAAATQRAGALMQVVAALQCCPDPTRGLERALDLCRRVPDADAAALLRRAGPYACETLVATAPDLSGQRWSLGDGVARGPICIADLGAAGLAEAMPTPAAGVRSLTAAPVVADPGRPAGRVLAPTGTVCERRAGLHGAGRHVPHCCHPGPAAAGPRCASAGSGRLRRQARLRRDLEHLADWQNRIVPLAKELLGAPGHAPDAAVDRALAGIGALAGSDRTHVFRLRQPGRFDDTHEWAAPGIEAIMDQPDEVLGEWRPDLEAGRPVHIPDVNALQAGSRVTASIGDILALPDHASFDSCEFVMPDHDAFEDADTAIDAYPDVRRRLPEISVIIVSRHVRDDNLITVRRAIRGATQRFPRTPGRLSRGLAAAAANRRMALRTCDAPKPLRRNRWPRGAAGVIPGSRRCVGSRTDLVAPTTAPPEPLSAAHPGSSPGHGHGAGRAACTRQPWAVLSSRAGDTPVRNQGHANPEVRRGEPHWLRTRTLAGIDARQSRGSVPAFGRLPDQRNGPDLQMSACARATGCSTEDARATCKRHKRQLTAGGQSFTPGS